ncbi:hypothetical protein ACET3Z_025347 [Daucus carota]
MENHKRSRKADEGMEELACEQTKGELSIVAERGSRKMKFVAEMRLLQYREERKGRHWVPTKDETRTEIDDPLEPRATAVLTEMTKEMSDLIWDHHFAKERIRERHDEGLKSVKGKKRGGLFKK